MADEDPIAILGYAYRAPGTPGIGRDYLWELLEQAKSAWSPVPAERFDAKAYYHSSSERAGCLTAQGGHFLSGDVFAFDAPFFNFNANEARYLDPQVRMLLECTWEAIENAGIPPLEIARRKIGVFAATGSSDYAGQLMNDLPTTSSYAALGTAPCMTSNRISHFFDLVGPSVSMEAACATSGYALHMACQSLKSGECSAALVGAAILNLGPENFSMLDTVGTLAPDGRSRSYDASCNGFGRGEGASCLLLKPLSEAVKCGDPIRAVIRNSVVSHCGRTPGISMPSGEAHEMLFRELHEQVGLAPRDTTYVEGHGTGTPVGDPVDASAVASVFGDTRSPDNPVYLGSIKSNIGHLEAASGLISVIKAVMMIEHERLLPTASFEKLNPAIKGHGKLCVLKRSIAWPAGSHKRVCVSNYGFGGANAAVLVEEAPAIHPQTAINGATESVNGVNGDVHEQSQKLFVFSAKSTDSLEAYLTSFQGYADALHHNDTKHLCFTLGQRRSHLSYRAAFVAHSPSSLVEQIAVRLGSTGIKWRKAGDLDLAFIFTGQGAQYARMAQNLLCFPIFTTALHEADRVLSELGATWSLQQELERPKADSRVDGPEISQPACTAIQIALVRLLRAFGVMPSIVIGHSSGEIAAAYAAGMISLQTALAIAFFRGKAAVEVLQDPNVHGAMLAVGVDSQGARELLPPHNEGYATIAAYNSTHSVTISGDTAAIEIVQKKAEARGLFVRRLRVDVAYHSRHMDAAAVSYASAIKPYCSQDGSEPPVDGVTFISTVTGSQAQRATVASPSYWVRNLLQPVRFADALTELIAVRDEQDPERGDRTLAVVEIGPHSALQNPIKDLLTHRNRQQVVYMPSLLRGQDDQQSILNLAARLFTSGIQIDFAAVNQIRAGSGRVLTDLPPYEWSKSMSFRHKSHLTRQKLHPQYPYHALLGWKNPSDVLSDQSFRQVFTLDDMPWLRDHTVAGDAIFPMAGYLALSAEAVRFVSRSSPSSLLIRDVHVKKALSIREDERVEITTRLRPCDPLNPGEEWTFEVMSLSESHNWLVHCHGIIRAEYATPESALASGMKSIIANQAQLNEWDVAEEYATMKRSGINWGPLFQGMNSLRAKNGTSVHTIGLRGTDYERFTTENSPVTVDPPVLDSFVHSVGAVQGRSGNRSNITVPTYIRRGRISNIISTDKFIVATQMHDHDSKSGNCALNVCAYAVGKDGLPHQSVLEVEGLQLRCISKADAALDPTALLPKSYLWTQVPSLELAEQGDIARMLPPLSPGLEEMRHSLRMGEVGVYYTAQALDIVRDEDLTHLPPHFEKWFAWARRIVAKRPLDREKVRATIDEVSQHDAQGRMVCLVGEELVRILRGQVQPLEIILQDGLLTRSYEEDQAVVRGAQGIANYVRLLSGIKPDLRVLEVGGGTASTTPAVLDVLTSRSQDDLPFHYTFTDISAGFFSNAKEKLRRFGTERVSYQKLDISQDPRHQGFAAESYDLVIAGNVLHATPDIEQTLRDVHTLLKPGGKLVLLELVDPDAALLPFTLLPGWWLSEDRYRSDEGPVLSSKLWHEALHQVGFSGIDISIPVAEHPVTHAMLMAVMCSSKDNANQVRDRGCNFAIVDLQNDTHDQEFAAAISQRMADDSSAVPNIVSLPEFTAREDHLAIFVDRPDHSLLSNLSKPSFDALKTALLHVGGLLWIIPEGSPPEAYLIVGLLRTLRHEDTSKSFLLFTNVPRDARGARAVAKVASKLRIGAPAEDAEHEYAWFDDQIMLPRLRENLQAKEVFLSDAGHLVRKQQPWPQDEDDVSLQLTVENVGDPSSIYFENSDIVHRKLKSEEILIRVEAAGLSLQDLQIINGQLPWKSPGLQGVGHVIRTGSDVTSVKEGDRVMFLSNRGALATHVCLPSDHACKLTETITNAAAAQVPLAYISAYIAVIHTARATKEDSILIHGASSAVGQACVAVAQRAGIPVYVTARTSIQLAELSQSYGIEGNKTFSYDPSEIREGVLRATRGEGVQIVINTLDDDDLLREAADIIADFGRYVSLARTKASDVGSPAVLRSNVTLCSVDIQKAMEKNKQLLAKCLGDSVDILQSLIHKPHAQPKATIPIADIYLGLQALQSSPEDQVVVTMSPNDVVHAEWRPFAQPTAKPFLKPDATYLISGGTGGIGRSLAAWMLEHGATNVVLLGRSGASRPEVAELLQKYSGLKAIACDVGDRAELQQALNTISHLPPVRGVVHGALYIRDSMFVNHTYEDWIRITKPKVEGTWNLDALLPADLDFFVSLASMDSVIGLVGQTIYSGTSSFLDHFSKHRISRGRPATSIHLPVVEGVGYVVDRDMVDSLKSSLGVSLTEAHVQTLVRGAIVGPASGLNADGVAISGVLWPMNADMPWEHWPHVRVLAAGLSTARGSPQKGDGHGAATTDDQVGSSHGLLQSLIAKVAEMTMMDIEEISADMPLGDLGLDSLVAVELRNWIRREGKVELPLTKIVGAKNLRELAGNIVT